MAPERSFRVDTEKIGEATGTGQYPALLPAPSTRFAVSLERLRRPTRRTTNSTWDDSARTS